MNAFMNLFMDYYEQGYLWTLTPTAHSPKDDSNGLPWMMYIHSAKVCFNCPVYQAFLIGVNELTLIALIFFVLRLIMDGRL